MKDKLIELIQDAVGGCARHWAEIIANYLIEHGVTFDEPKKCSYWSNVAGGRTICRHCGEYPLYDYFGRQKFSRFCPTCGFDMSGEETCLNQNL